MGKEILHSNQIQITERTKFKYPPLGKALKKQTWKQDDALNSLNLSGKHILSKFLSKFLSVKHIN